MGSLMGYRLASLIQDQKGELMSENARGIIDYVCLTVKDLAIEKKLYLSLGMKVVSEAEDKVELWSGMGPTLVLRKKGVPVQENEAVIRVSENIELGISMQELKSTRRRIQQLGYQVIEIVSNFFKRKEYVIVTASGTEVHLFKRRSYEASGK